ncbi:polyprenyl synthetase family protein [Pseudonocardia asaccharolytica]|uniref:Geranylgeranyl pyrophosphate synthase n=1 Tax=Pseudonocardia asaccharolytica DSM 44247 = NBRC 16224 TaxID=1123024 RepID=A0A511CXA0_9PSEU|nr:polyprenyl synthetase family protein [Pseudonocardia asaccharolytica]GEL17186.1 geranylgeranyl pyrophosphate synthase [Pseudonocardia asaccharolytica DSM 44247 = NBRC 16224]
MADTGVGGVPGVAQAADRGPRADRHDTDRDLLRRIEAELAAYLDRRRAEAAEIDPAFAAATEALRGFVLGGGKRIRPTFAWWGWRGAGGDPDDEITPAVLRALSALELIQACALVHDDLIDASATRRGRPTVHVAFADRHADAGWAGRPARFGAAAAILLGDLALAWADDMLRDAGLPAAALRRAAEPWRSMRTELLAGQYLDVLGQASADTSTHGALRINRFKTAAYTVERPLHLGAAIADAAPALVRSYRRFGADIGVAFQLRDDLLDVFGDPAVTGKAAGDDLREGKRTLLVALALERAEERGATAARTVLTDALGDRHLDAAAVERIRDVLCELGAAQAVEQRIAALAGAALDALTTADIAEPAASRLAELAVTATRRRS